MNIDSVDRRHWPMMFVAQRMWRPSRGRSRVRTRDTGRLDVSRLVEPFGMLWNHMAINPQAGRDHALVCLKPDDGS
jgi:hypothetical protein